MDLARPLLSDRASFRRCILVTDGIFSMDGDTAPLQALGELAREHSSWLVVDDAHGTGVMGPEGSGTIQALGVQSLVDVQIGTLSKAVGAAGGFAAGTRSLCRYLRHFARSFVFSTAMPPAIAAGAAQGVQLSREGEHLRRRLRLNSGSIRDLLTRHGFSVPPGEGPIIPVLVGDANAAMSLSEDLLNQRVFVPAIRYPSVPRGSARLRVTATAALEPSDLEWFDQALAKVRRVRTR
jgi:7-keto-8-aminopelargonate synthetase-like enzyme